MRSGGAATLRFALVSRLGVGLLLVVWSWSNCVQCESCTLVEPLSMDDGFHVVLGAGMSWCSSQAEVQPLCLARSLGTYNSAQLRSLSKLASAVFLVRGPPKGSSCFLQDCSCVSEYCAECHNLLFVGVPCCLAMFRVTSSHLLRRVWPHFPKRLAGPEHRSGLWAHRSAVQLKAQVSRCVTVVVLIVHGSSCYTRALRAPLRALRSHSITSVRATQFLDGARPQSMSLI